MQAKDEDSMTPLMLATRNGHVEVHVVVDLILHVIISHLGATPTIIHCIIIIVVFYLSIFQIIIHRL